MTAQELVDKARFLLAAGQPDSAWLDVEVEAQLSIAQAMHDLGMMIAKDRWRFGLLQQDYSVPLNGSTGAGDLIAATGALTSAADMIWDSVPQGRVKDANDAALVYVPDVAEFESYVLPGFSYYTLYQQKIYTRTSTGTYATDKTGVISPVTVTANFFPALTSAVTLPAQLEDEAVQSLIRVLVQKNPGLPAPPK